MSEQKKYVLRLYISGATPENQTAILSFKSVLQEHSVGDYLLEIIDMLSHPELADEHGVVVTPMLVRVNPAPLQKVILDFSSVEKVRFGVLLLTQ